MNEAFIDVGTGGSLRYLEGGNPDGEPLLLLHGVHLNADFFARSICPHLASHYRLIAPDLRGHGRSLRSDEPYTLANYARDVIALHRQLIGAPCHLLGFSLGGNVALTACVAAPALARKLVVADVAPFVNRAGLERIVAAQRTLPDRFESLDSLQRYFYAAYAGVSRSYVDMVLAYMWRRDEQGGYVSTYDRRIWALPADEREAELLALAEEVPGLSLPVLLLRGGNSDILSPEGAQRFLDLLQHGRLVEIDDTDHGLLHQRPEPCAQAIHAFLANPEGAQS